MILAFGCSSFDIISLIWNKICVSHHGSCISISVSMYPKLLASESNILAWKFLKEVWNFNFHMTRLTYLGFQIALICHSFFINLEYVFSLIIWVRSSSLHFLHDPVFTFYECIGLKRKLVNHDSTEVVSESRWHLLTLSLIWAFII